MKFVKHIPSLLLVMILLAGCASNGMDAANGRPMCPMMDGKSCCCCQKMMESKDCSCCQKMMESGMMKDKSAAPADAVSPEDHKKHHPQDNKEVK
ncbi:MAG: hypothetical protein EYC62_06530 [Alphaproteobacteria bacterium]|nr:MAG: hypothetical protein EYC62_06530 [Alphaproteobacteria bacterium]